VIIDLHERALVLRHARAGDRRDDSVAELQRRFATVPGAEQATVADAGHMLHHDQPEVVAGLIRDFLRRHG